MKVTSSLTNRCKSLCLAVTAAFLTLTGTAFGITWVDEDYGDPLKFLHSGSPSYSSTFNILIDGYDPNTMHVTSAVASFAFADDGDSYLEYVDIYLGGSLFLGDQEVDGTHDNIPSSYDWYHGNLSGTMLANLQDGVISYQVTVTSGDTYLKRAKLVAQGEYNRVPEGGSTAVLLGSALVGIGILGRRQRR